MTAVRLRFDARKVAELIKHSENNPEKRVLTLGGKIEALMKERNISEDEAIELVMHEDRDHPLTDTKPPAGVELVHDYGVYLMSNANEGEGKPGVAYALGCNPRVDEDWYENVRKSVGGDDFSQGIDAAAFKGIDDPRAKYAVIEVTNNLLRFSVEYGKVGEEIGPLSI
jgi:hypothetical protein